MKLVELTLPFLDLGLAKPKSQFYFSCEKALSVMKEKGPFEVEVIHSIRFAIKLAGAIQTKQYIHDHAEDESFEFAVDEIIDKLEENPKLTNEEIAKILMADFRKLEEIDFLYKTETDFWGN